MRRIACTPRPDWQAHCERVGLSFHSIDGTYWNEAASYLLTPDQAARLEQVADELHQRCLQAVEWIIGEQHFAPFRLSPLAIKAIQASWQRGDPSLCGRFDFSWNGSGEPKLLEYNADTPGCLLESGLVQRHWQQQVFPQHTQFNQLHESLVQRWQAMPAATLWHFTALHGHIEDEVNAQYLQATAREAGLDTDYLPIEQIGLDLQQRCFVDLQNRPIRHCSKLYPWEWLAKDSFAEQIEPTGIRFVEPAWKLLLSSKALLPILWQLFPDHPNLLPASFGNDLAMPYVRKPLYSRKGCNIQIVAAQHSLHSTGPYARGSYIQQAFAPLAEFDGRFPLLGVWMVGDQVAGLGIREDHSLITRDSAHFVPHLIEA